MRPLYPAQKRTAIKVSLEIPERRNPPLCTFMTRALAKKLQINCSIVSAADVEVRVWLGVVNILNIDIFVGTSFIVRYFRGIFPAPREMYS